MEPDAVRVYDDESTKSLMEDQLGVGYGSAELTRLATLHFTCQNLRSDDVQLLMRSVLPTIQRGQRAVHCVIIAW